MRYVCVQIPVLLLKLESSQIPVAEPMARVWSVRSLRLLKALMGGEAHRQTGEGAQVGVLCNFSLAVHGRLEC